MLVCRLGPTTASQQHMGVRSTTEATANGSRLGDGGPVFLPRRKPSAIGETLLAHAVGLEPLTSYEEGAHEIRLDTPCDATRT